MEYEHKRGKSERIMDYDYRKGGGGGGGGGEKIWNMNTEKEGVGTEVSNSAKDRDGHRGRKKILK